MWKITFTLKGFLVAVIYNEHKTMEAAIDAATRGVVNDYDSVRAERVR